MHGIDCGISLREIAPNLMRSEGLTDTYSSHSFAITLSLRSDPALVHGVNGHKQ